MQRTHSKLNYYPYDLVPFEEPSIPGRITGGLRTKIDFPVTKGVSRQELRLPDCSASTVVPRLSVPNQVSRPHAWKRLSSILTEDAGCAQITAYQIWDGSVHPSFWVDGKLAATRRAVQFTNLNGVWVRGATTPGVERHWVRAFNGERWGPWASFTMTTQ